MSDDIPDSIGIWTGDAEAKRLVRRFDIAHAPADGSYSRSEAVLDAMRLSMKIEEALEDAGLELEGRDRDAFLRQAILDAARE